MAALASKTPRVRVAAILGTEGRIVVVRHRKGPSEYHLLPGGGVQFGESLGQALVREVAEETGLECTVGPPVLLNDSIAPDLSRHVIQITFLASIVGGEPHSTGSDSRVVAVELVSPSQLARLDLRPPIAPQVAEIIDSLEPAAARYLGPLWATHDQPHS